MKYGQKGTASTLVVIGVVVWLIVGLSCGDATEFWTWTIMLWGIIGGCAYGSYKQMLKHVEQSKKKGGEPTKDYRGK